MKPTVGVALITGGFGFIGSHLAEALLAQGWLVRVLDPASPPPDLDSSQTKLTHIEADVRDLDALQRAARGADLIVHLSSLVGVDRYLDQTLDVIDVTVTGTRNVLDTARDESARLLVASTSEVYGRNPSLPWSENSDRVLGPTTADRWSYSSSKAVAEHMVFAHHQKFGTQATVLRYFNVYGPRQRPAYVVSGSIHAILNGRPARVYDNGVQTRCFTYVRDAVEATIAVASTPAPCGSVLNVGGTVETKIRDVLSTIQQFTGSATPAIEIDTTTAFGRVYEDIGRRIPDVQRIEAAIGWRASTALEDGLDETIKWARANEWWLQSVAGKPHDGSP